MDRASIDSFFETFRCEVRRGVDSNKRGKMVEGERLSVF